MSHFSQIKTQIRNLSSLKLALNDLNVSWSDGPSSVRGYQGQTHQAEVVIPQDNDYDLGFRWNGQEYELVADLQYWQQPLSVEGFIQQLTQRYAYHTVTAEAEKQGFQVAAEEKAADGSIRLVVQRWSA